MKKNIYIVPVTIVENQITIQTHICQASKTQPGANYGGGDDPNDPDDPDPGSGGGPGMGGDLTKKRNSDFGSIW